MATLVHPLHAHSPACVPARIRAPLTALGSAPPPRTHLALTFPPTSISHSSRECRIGSFWPRVPSGHPDPSLGHSSCVSWSPADEPNPKSRQAEDEDDEVALLVPSSSEWVPSAEKRGLWGGSGGSGQWDDPRGLHPGGAEHALSVLLTLPCPGRRNPHCALGQGHCTLVPDKTPAEPSQHHHPHLPAAVSPHPYRALHSLSRLALAGRDSCISPQTPIPRESTQEPGCGTAPAPCCPSVPPG